ncbi:unnamed protein product [Lampetra planeri]
MRWKNRKWREVVNRLDLLLVTIGRLVVQLSASATAIQGTVSGPLELPPTAWVPASETTQLQATIRKEGTVGPAGAIWHGPRDLPELPLAAAVPAAETTWLLGAIFPVEGMAWPVGAIGSGMRDDAKEAPRPAAL